MALQRMTRSQRLASGWDGWAYSGNLYTIDDETKGDDVILQELATQALKTKDVAACVRKLSNGRSRIMGFGYTMQGYADTPNGPRLWLIAIDGG